MNAHPKVFVSSAKETNFFSGDAEYEKGLGCCRKRHFARGSEFVERGDISPAYLPSPTPCERIRTDLPPAAHRFVVLLRDPVERAYSNYWHMVRMGAETGTFEDAVRADVQWQREDVYGGYTLAYLYGGK